MSSYYVHLVTCGCFRRRAPEPLPIAKDWQPNEASRYPKYVPAPDVYAAEAPRGVPNNAGRR